MENRTTQTVVNFTSSFLLPYFDTQQPAGRYRVDYDEELIECASRLAWRRVGAFIYLPAVGEPGLTEQMVPINMVDLRALLALNDQPSIPPPAVRARYD